VKWSVSQSVLLVNKACDGGYDVQEGKSVDNVHPLSAWRSKVTYDEQDLARLAAKLRVERARPDLGVWRELESLLESTKGRWRLSDINFDMDGLEMKR
jgi:hypothetical protein